MNTFMAGLLGMGLMMTGGGIFVFATSECNTKMKFSLKPLSSNIELSKDACPKPDNKH